MHLVEHAYGLEDMTCTSYSMHTPCRACLQAVLRKSRKRNLQAWALCCAFSGAALQL